MFVMFNYGTIFKADRYYQVLVQNVSKNVPKGPSLNLGKETTLYSEQEARHFVLQHII